jgi:hypothetical protein
MFDIVDINRDNVRRIKEGWTKSDRHPAAVVIYDGLRVTSVQQRTSVEEAREHLRHLRESVLSVSERAEVITEELQ